MPRCCKATPDPSFWIAMWVSVWKSGKGEFQSFPLILSLTQQIWALCTGEHPKGMDLSLLVCLLFLCGCHFVHHIDAATTGLITQYGGPQVFSSHQRHKLLRLWGRHVLKLAIRFNIWVTLNCLTMKSIGTESDRMCSDGRFYSQESPIAASLSTMRIMRHTRFSSNDKVASSASFCRNRTKPWLMHCCALGEIRGCLLSLVLLQCRMEIILL